MTAEPSKRKEIIKDKQFLSSQKLGANEADIEKIKIQFMAIVRDIKSGMQKKEPTKAVATAEAAICKRSDHHVRFRYCRQYAFFACHPCLHACHASFE